MNSKDSHQAPVILRNRRPVVANTKWQVCLDHLCDARGREVRDYLILLPAGKQRPDRVTGVTVMPILEGKVVLLRNYRHAIETFAWEVVRGFVDTDEEPEAAALRELVEETGLQCDAGDLVPLGDCAPEASTMAGRSRLFAAVNCRPGPPVDHAEIGLGGWTKVELADAAAMLDRFEIEDATTEIAIRRYLAR